MILMQTLFMALALTGLVASGPQDERVTKAFDHYEAIRVALAADSITDVAGEATALALLAEQIAGADAKKHAEGVANAKDVKAVREHFGPLSAALIPVFEKARLKDVSYFTCPMVKQSWAQKGKEIQNPYYGKEMLTCGVPKK